MHPRFCQNKCIIDINEFEITEIDFKSYLQEKYKGSEVISAAFIKTRVRKRKLF